MPDLLQQLACLARLAESNHEGLVVAGPDGRCLFINQVAGTLGRLAEGETITLAAYLARLRERSRSVDARWPTLAVQMDLAALTRVPHSFRLTCGEESASMWGQKVQYALTLAPLTTGKGHMIGAALFLRDMTPLMQDEVLESSLLSSISHDLRTPLTAIKAAVTGLLQEEVIWDEQLRREMLQDINEETDRLTMLVRSLLEISRIEGGALRLQTEWCDLVEILHTVLDRAGKIARGQHITADLHLPLPLVQGDFMQLDRVLTNLLENAAKYSPVGTEIRVVAEMRAGEVWIRVLDEGPGIPVEERERIFQKFYRLKQRRSLLSTEPAVNDDQAGSPKQWSLGSLVGGAGLGLAICRGIVAQHGGRIWMEPRATGGSCFIFTLPVEASAPMSGGEVSESGGLREVTEHLAANG